MRRTPVLIFSGAALFVAACAGGDYGRDDAVSDLQEGGMTEAQAVCVADEMEAREIDFQEASETDTDSELFQEITDIAVDCKVDNPGGDGGGDESEGGGSEGDGGGSPDDSEPEGDG